jgi:hypothetical protein
LATAGSGRRVREWSGFKCCGEYGTIHFLTQKFHSSYLRNGSVTLLADLVGRKWVAVGFAGMRTFNLK